MQSVECLERIDRMADYLRSNQTSKLMQYTLTIIMKFFLGKSIIKRYCICKLEGIQLLKVALLSCLNAPLDTRQLA